METKKPEPAKPGKQIAVIDEVYHTLKKMEPEFQAALGNAVSSEKFLRVARTALQRDPALLAADRLSLYNACMRCATDGLIPDGREAALVAFKQKDSEVKVVQYFPMVGGYCKRARNSGEIKDLDALVVYEKDKFEAWVDETGHHFKHVQDHSADKGKPRLTYAFARTKDGGFYFEVIDEAQMTDIKNVSKAKNEGIWDGKFQDEMRRKSAMRRLCKYRLPSSSDIQTLIEHDDEVTGIATDKPKQIESDKPSRLNKIIEGQVVTEPAPPAAAAPAAEPAKPADIEEVPI